MKKTLIPLLFATSGLFITGCANVSDIPSKEPISDLLENDTRNADLVKPNNGLKKAEDVKDFEYPDVVNVHYHRDDNSYTGKCLWLWSPNKSDEVPDREFPLTDEDDWSKVCTFEPKKLFRSELAIGFSFIVKTEGTWDGQSTENPILYDEYKPVKGDDGKYYLDVYVTHTGTKVLTYPTKDDAMSDRIDNAFISKDLKKINIYSKDGTGNKKSVIKDFKIFKFNEAYQGLSDDLKQTVKNEYLLFSADNVNKTNVAVKFNNVLSINQQYVIEAHFEDKSDRLSTYTVGFDNLYSSDKFNELNYKGDDLGAHVVSDGNGGEKTVFKLWAPTAFKLQLKVYDENADSSTLELSKFGNDFEISKANSYALYDMKLNLNTAVWELEIPENLDGKYYTYKVWNSAGINDNVTDPYALSAGMNGKRAMVTDMDSDLVTPEGWDQVPTCWDGKENFDITSPQELSISEVHIRDLTMNKTWGGDPKLAGTFKGFIQEGTTYTDKERASDDELTTPATNRTVKTGYDHLVEYGVNAIQLLPIFDQDNGERAPIDAKVEIDGTMQDVKVVDYNTLDKYNWGYSPQNYNVVEGMYSTDPRDGHLRVKEFRELVQKFALNENHTRIIMDVVFNHMSSAPASSFEKLMPNYAFRILPDGALSNASACGNEVKTDAPMMRKFIVDSLCTWAKEYKIKGFRFDLMGAIDIKTLSMAADKLYEIDPDIYIYGEGWHAEDAPAIPNDFKATNENISSQLYPGRDVAGSNAKYKGKGYVGGFNNKVRDSLKGDNNIGETAKSIQEGARWNYRGFIGGRGEKEEEAKMGLLGANLNNQASWNPLQNINYASCHDNYTLFDQLNWLAVDDDPNEIVYDKKHNNASLLPDPKLVARASVAVNGMILMGNSTSFINGGEELFRTKIITDTVFDELSEQDKGFETKMYNKRISHNSYKSSDLVNSYDYARKAEYLEYFNMYKDLVKLKKDLKFDAALVAKPDQNSSSPNKDSYRVGDGSIAHIENGNTGNGRIGMFRLGNSGVYHAYLTNKYNGFRTISSAGKLIFQNTTESLSGTTIHSDHSYGLYIFKESN